MDFILSLLPAYLDGTRITLAVSAMAIAAGLAVGLGLALARTFGHRWVGRVALGYMTLIRALPEIAALFLFYFVIGAMIPLPPLLAAVLALAAISSAYQAEIFRGSIQSLGPGQMTAARAVGLTRWQAIRYVILPQALRKAIPGWSNEASGMIKNSALVYALGVPELLRQAEYVSARTLEPFLAFGTAAVIYLVLTIATNSGLRLLEHRLAVPE